MRKFTHITRILVFLTPLLALLPVAQVLVDWVEMSRMVAGPSLNPTARGYDWVLWQEQDGVIVAGHVFPRGPAAAAGLRPGDVFFQLDHQLYFNAEDLRHAIEGIPPGTTALYTVQRDGTFVEAYVRLTRYPTFLYPLSGMLWQFAIWGFMLGAFFHLLGLIIVGPLALRSRKSWFSLLLILVSSLWMVGNLLRLLAVQLLGPPVAGGGYDEVFQGLTLIGLVGWIGFPALLLHKVCADAPLLRSRLTGSFTAFIYLPAVVLGLTALVTTLQGSWGPFTQDGLVAPILFYACCYITTAAALVLILHLLRPVEAEELLGSWNRTGSVITLVIGLLAALSVYGILPILDTVTDTTSGWLIVSTQLLSIAPIILVSLATLKHGKVDQVLSRGLTYLTVLGLIFFAFVGGMGLIDPYLSRVGASRNVVAGFYVIVLLLVFERIARRVRLYAASFFTTDRHRTRQTMSRFQEQMRGILSLHDLLNQTVQTVGEAFKARSTILFLQASGPDGPWLSGRYHPEPPYLTERVLALIWPYMQEEGRIWARNREINESSLPDDLSELLEQRGAAIAIPIMGEDVPIGLLVMSPKRQRRAVYNLEDLDLLRSLSGQLALAVERLKLVEREKALVRESAEAQLVALRAQINPHFLFNALNTIIALIEERPEEAEATVEHLASIFRHILQTSSRPFVSMADEFQLVSHYLSIEQARFGPNLEVEMELEPALRTQPVPAFAVQTLVENAVKHGLEKRRGGGRLRIACRSAEDGLAEVVVTDTGTGIPALFGAGDALPPPTDFFGLGLRNVSARLVQLYGRPDLLRFRSAPEEGTTVVLRLPVERPHPSLPAGDGSRSHPVEQVDV